MFDKSNIEIFILTYNRKDFLHDAIISVLNQSLGLVDITVMDNASNDGTEELIKNLQIKYTNIKYHKREINNPIDNFKQAVQLASKDYMMLFHDDDILHPDYLKYALMAINRHPTTTVVSSYYKEFTCPNNLNWKKVSKTIHYIKSRNNFVDYLCYHQNFTFSSTIYKTENLKKYVTKQSDELMEFKLMGKLCDKPMVVNSMQSDDDVIILANKYLVRYRVHPGQDTQTPGPYYDQIIEFNKFYKSYMSRNWYSNFLFNLINYKQLKCAYIWGKDYTLTLNEFIKKAIDEGAGCKYTQLCISQFGTIFIELAHIFRKFLKSNYRSENL